MNCSSLQLIVVDVVVNFVGFVNKADVVHVVTVDIVVVFVVLL